MANQPDINTHLEEEELLHFKDLLLEKRKEAQRKLEEIRSTQSNLDEADDADYSSMAHHMGDVGSEEQASEMNAN